MKKIIALLSILLLTGCLGEAGKGYITKTCSKTENINGYKKETEIKVKSKQGNVEEIIIKEIYDKNLDIESITKSKKSERNTYKNIELEINENVFTYKIDTKKLTDEEKEKYNIKTEQHRQIKQYEEEGYTCK
jgi:hypothetical protein